MRGHAWSWVLVPLLLALVAGVGYSVLTLPETSAGLATAVQARLAASGVDNPVTAVLLNFRGYDTLLEMAVLSLAVVGIWSLAVMPRRRVGAPDAVLAFLVQIMVPFMVLLAAYLLWAGSHSAGGAFQAGAVLGAATVLMLLAGAPLPGALSHWPLRMLLMLGLGTFAVTGLAMMLLGARFLEYPPTYAKHIILLVETAAAVSIGLILAGAFRGGRPPPEPPP